MENLDGVWFDGTFYYKNLGNQIKLSWQQFNHNLETIKNVSENIDDQLNAATQSAGSALASQRAAAVSATEALNAKTASEAAKDLSEEANTSAQAAKNTAVSAKDTTVSANTTAQSAKTAAELARNDSVAARNIAQTSATTATNAKNAAETARNTATQKAAEANQSAIDAEYWAGLSEESAGEVTSVQGKKGKVDLKRVDFSWMGSAANFDSGYSGGLRAQYANEARGLVYSGSSGDAVVRYLMSESTGGWARAVMQVKLQSDPEARGGLYLGAHGGVSSYSKGVFGFGKREGSTQEWWTSSHSIWVYPDSDPSVGGKTIYHTGNLPQATQAELNAGTQTAPRLFSPKQLAAKSVPAGTVITFAAESAPEGYLKCNGALVNRTAYSALFANIGTAFGEGDGSTTFALPDLRGEFVRGWDDGRGVDVGRSFGSGQVDEFKSHSHSSSFRIAGGSGPSSAGIAIQTTSQNVPFLKTANEGSNETRPRNIALLYCIKY